MNIFSENSALIFEIFVEDKHLNVPTNDTAFMIKFLRAEKYDVKNTHKLFQNYFEFQQTYKEYTANLDPTKVRDVWEKEIVQVMPQRDIHGRRIMILNFGRKY